VESIDGDEPPFNHPRPVTVPDQRPEADAGDELGDSTTPTPDILDTPAAGRRVIRGSAARIADYVITNLLALAVAPLLIRHLGVVRFGQYAAVGSLITIVAGVTEAGLTNIGVREFVSHDRPKGRRIVQNLLGARMVITIVGIAAAVAFALAAGYRDQLVLGTFLAGLGVAIGALAGSYGIALQTSLRIVWIAALDLLQTFVMTGLIVAFVIADAPLVAFLAVGIPAWLAVVVPSALLTHREIPLTPGFEVREWWRLLRMALPYTAATAIGIVYFRITIVLMSVISTGRQVGLYSASFRVIEAVAALATLLVGAAFPVLARAARDDSARFRYGLQKVTEVSSIVGVWAALGVIIGAKLAITLIGGSRFAASVEILRIQGVSLIATFLAATWGYVLLAQRRHRPLVTNSLLALLTVVVLGLALVPDRGARGAAIATTAAEFVLAGAYLVVMLRAGDAMRVDFRFARWLVAAAALAALPYILGVPVIPALILATAIYFSVLYIVGAIPPELVAALVPARIRERRTG
jgi:O-antigen/teichoic acid export membrane protein